MSALLQWWREIDRRERTVSAPHDALWRAACAEMADLEFQREVAIPHRIYLAELQTRRRKEAHESITADLHALERWRQVVLESDKRRSPLDVAAAWELTAAECDRLGNHDAANEARAMARAQLKRGVA